MRIERRKWTKKDIGYSYSGSLLLLIDNTIKQMLRINEDELCYLCEKMNEDDINLIDHGEKYTFSEKRRIITMLNTYFIDYQPSEKKEEESEKCAIYLVPKNLVNDDWIDDII